MAKVLISGGTGYMDTAGPALLAREHEVRVLARAGIDTAVPAGAAAIIGDAFNSDAVIRALPSDGTLVHLVGTPHPSPSKAAEFQRVDLPAALASWPPRRQGRSPQLVYCQRRASGARHGGVHRVARGRGKGHCRAGLTATVLRPWYVLGPASLADRAMPMYGLLGLFPATRASAQRSGW